MKYMILLFGNESYWESLSEEEIAAEMEKHSAYDRWCEENGVAVIGGEELDPSPAAITFHADGGQTDGPFLEIKEQLGGFYVIETDSPELAREAARRAPNYGGVELRPVASRD